MRHGLKSINWKQLSGGRKSGPELHAVISYKLYLLLIFHVPSQRKVQPNFAFYFGRQNVHCSIGQLFIVNASSTITLWAHMPLNQMNDPVRPYHLMKITL